MTQPAGITAPGVQRTAGNDTARIAAILLAAMLVVAIALFLLGRHLGYRAGYDTAYRTEHSHFLFQKTRGDRMAKRIAKQRSCVERVIGVVPPIRSSGLEAIGQSIGTLMALYAGTTRCDRDAGLTGITSSQYGKIFGTRR